MHNSLKMFSTLEDYKQRQIEKEVVRNVKYINTTIVITMIVIVSILSFNFASKLNITAEEFIRDNNYELVEATFERDRITIDGENKDFIKINNKSLNNYWANEGYKPQTSEKKKVYFNGDDIQTKSNISFIVEDNNITTVEIVVKTILINLCVLLLWGMLFPHEKFKRTLRVNMLENSAKKYMVQL